MSGQAFICMNWFSYQAQAQTQPKPSPNHTPKSIIFSLNFMQKVAMSGQAFIWINWFSYQTDLITKYIMHFISMADDTNQPNFVNPWRTNAASAVHGVCNS